MQDARHAMLSLSPEVDTEPDGLAWRTVLDPQSGSRITDRVAIHDLIAAHAVQAADTGAVKRATAGRFAATEVAMTWRRAAPAGLPITVRSRILAVSLGRTVLRCTVHAGPRHVADAIVVADQAEPDASLSLVPQPSQRLGGWRRAAMPIPRNAAA